MEPLGKLIIKKAKKLRQKGFSHRDIAKKLYISLGSTHFYTQEINITQEQHLRLKRRSLAHLKPTREQCRLGGINRQKQYKSPYTKEGLLASLVSFYKLNGRVPVKREMPHYSVYRRLFGTWNRAVETAGLEPYPVLFAKKYMAKDGHVCDSLSEQIIDNWLFSNHLQHQINVPYSGDKRLTADFLVEGYCWIEFFGLSGEHRRYDILKKRKLKLVKTLKLNFIAIYPDSLFPKNKLVDLLGYLRHNQNTW